MDKRLLCCWRNAKLEWNVSFRFSSIFHDLAVSTAVDSNSEKIKSVKGDFKNLLRQMSQLNREQNKNLSEVEGGLRK
jgi:hypothetical protein